MASVGDFKPGDLVWWLFSEPGKPRVELPGYVVHVGSERVAIEAVYRNRQIRRQVQPEMLRRREPVTVPAPAPRKRGR